MSPSPSPAIIDKLQTILSQYFMLSNRSVMYAEVATGEAMEKGIIEFRDALTHIHRALNLDDEEKALNDLECAAEHIRRGGVESMQTAATKEFYDVINLVKTPPLIYRILMLEIPKKGEVNKLKEIAWKKIAEGRDLKSDQGSWANAIASFTESIEASKKIKELCPTKVERTYRAFCVMGGLATILSLLLAIWAIFFKTC